MSDAIKIDVVFEPTGTDQQFNKVEKKAKTAGQKASVSFSEGFSQNIKKSFSGVRNQILGTVGAFFAFNAVTSTLRDATKSALELEQAITEVNTILPKNTKLTNEQTNALKDYAKQFGTSARAQVKSYYDIVSAGVTDSAKANELLATANKLAIGGITSVGSSIDILTSILNAYGQENITAKEAADSLFTAVRLGKTTIDQLANSLAPVLPGARAAGVNLDRVSASMAVLTSNGLQTNLAVTRLNALFAAFARAGDALGKGMDSAAIKSDGLEVVLSRLEKRTGGNSGELLKLLGSVEAVQAAQILMRDGAKQLNDSLGEMSEKAGATEGAFGKMGETGAQQLKVLNAEINALKTSLGESIAPVLTNIISKFRTMGAVVSDALGGNKAKTPVEDLQQNIDELTLKLASLYKTRNDLVKEQKTGDHGILRGIALPGRIDDANREIAVMTEKLNTLKMTRDQFKESNLNQEQQKEIDGLRTAQGEYENYRENLIQTQELKKAQMNEMLVLAAVAAQQREEQRIADMNAQELFVEGTQNQIAEMVKFFGIGGKRIQQISQQIGAVAFSALSNGVGRAFQNVGKALASGENAFQAFADGLKSILADVASSIGDVFIKWGVANLVSGNVGMGSAQIAAGGALKILSGLLGSSGGGASEGASAPTGSAIDPVNVTDAGVNEFQETAEREAGTNVQLVVQGSLVHQDELGQFMAETLSESFEKQGVTLTDARFT